jgi:creatinine amidohydrolase
MTGLPRPYWQDMTTEEVGRLDAGRVIAILPVGAIEQHGPHLPVCTDVCIGEGIALRALALLPEGLPATFLPMLPVGKSDEHLAFAGTLTLSALTLIRLWTEVGDSVARAGLRKLVLLNSHGGQVSIMDVVARDLRVRQGMLVMAWSWFSAGIPGGLFPEDEQRFGIHAGAIETSMMLHLRPDLVHMDKAQDFRPLMADMEKGGYRRLSALGSGRMGWMAQDLHRSGACGNAVEADAERGRALVEHAASAMVELLREMDRFPLETLHAPRRDA